MTRTTAKPGPVAKSPPRRRRPELAAGAAVAALLAIGLLAVAYTSPWFEYDFSSGRKTAPDGAYTMEGDGVERRHVTFQASGWEGDTEPSDPALAERAGTVAIVGMGTAAVALLFVAAGEIPLVHRVLRRRVSLAFVAVALAAVAAVAAATWVWLPQSMAGHGVVSQYTARLDEPDGYTHTTMLLGWYAAGAALLPIIAAGLFKFQAGTVNPELLEDHRAEAA